MRVLALFLWLAFPAAAYGIYVSWGTPHLVWSYTFRTGGSPYDPFADRSYISCTYVGWTGVHTVPARAARCPVFRFFPAEAG